MQTKKNSKGKDSFWKRLTKPQLRLVRGGDGDSSSDSSSASTSAGGVAPGPPSGAPPVGGR